MCSCLKFSTEQLYSDLNRKSIFYFHLVGKFQAFDFSEFPSFYIRQ